VSNCWVNSSILGAKSDRAIKVKMTSLLEGQVLTGFEPIIPNLALSAMELFVTTYM
jgi:hypothetical protein